ncbi:MAG: DUF924 domain-containing protein [Rhodocyclaceae bacterium]|nr:DUF924 domain-containing protein [Rhodocyclaceae bacterium]
MPESAASVLEFWFGEEPAAQARGWWFAKDPHRDRLIARRFAGLVELALAGRLSGWGTAPRARLARILVVDQLPRNIYRGSARAFAGDALAVSEALALIDGGEVHTLAPLQRVFAYLPLEHAEDLALQRRSVSLFAALAAQDATSAHFLAYARRHHDVIQRFGRFPHRNGVLGRASSAAEQTFLARPGSGF